MSRIITTVSETPSLLEIETAAGSNIFTQEPFTSSVITVSIDEEGNGSFDAVTTPGTPLNITGYSYNDPQPPRKIVWAVDRSGYIYFKKGSSGYGTSGSLVIRTSDSSTVYITLYSWSIGSIPGNYVYVAGCYDSVTNRFFIGYDFVDSLTVAPTNFSIKTITAAAEVELCKKIFYGIPNPDRLRVVRKSPDSTYFKYGQASTLRYALEDDNGIVWSECKAVAPAVTQGWSFNASTQLLTHEGATEPQTIEVSITYGDREYTRTDTFYPPNYEPMVPDVPDLPGGNIRSLSPSLIFLQGYLAGKATR
jgi:hypothetical protein